MTEKEAWLELARLWDKPIIYNGYPMGLKINYCVTVGGICCIGLCGCVNNLHILIDTSVKMSAKIHNELYGRKWLAEFDLEGAKIRAGFCRRMSDVDKYSS